LVHADHNALDGSIGSYYGKVKVKTLMEMALKYESLWSHIDGGKFGG